MAWSTFFYTAIMNDPKVHSFFLSLSQLRNISFGNSTPVVVRISERVIYGAVDGKEGVN